MKYNINARKTLDDSLLFWIQKYIYTKTINHSDRLVEDKLAYKIKLMTLSIEDIYQNIIELENDLKVIRGLGNKSVVTYVQPLIRLYNSILKYNLRSMEDINKDIVKKHLLSLEFKSSSTLTNHQSIINTFLKYINDNNLDINHHSHIYDTNIDKNIVPKQTKLPSFLNKEELSLFLKANDEIKYTKQPGIMNRIIIKILVFTGIRVDELVNIKTDDLYLEDNNYIIKVTGKGNKQRNVTIKKTKIYSDLQRWNRIRLTRIEYLFYSTKFNKLNSTSIYHLVSNLLKYANIKKDKKGPHLLRHTFATHLYMKYNDLLLVKDALGHDDIKTVNIYTHLIKKETAI